jgi:integrase/recombinase XerC
MRQKIEEFFRHLEKNRNCSGNTIVSYRNDIESFSAFLIADRGREMSEKTFGNLEIRDVRLWLAHRNSLGLSNRSNARALAAVRSLYRFLEKNYGIRNEIIFGIRGPKLPKSLPRNVNHNNIIKMIQSVKNFSKREWEARRDVALMVLIYSCGLRISEALNLNRNSFVEKNRVRIIGKGDRERVIMLLPISVRLLEEYTNVCPYDTENDILFFGSRGGRYRAAIFEKLVKNIRNTLGLSSSVTPHSLRHSFATELLANGADLRSIQELLGHASLKTTQIYTHVDLSSILKVYSGTHPVSIAEARLGEKKKS